MADAKSGKNIKIIGIIFMIFAACDILNAIVGIFDPSAMGLDSGTYPQGLITASIIIAIIVSLIEFYFGWIAFKERPSKLAATVCLILGVLTLIAAITNLVSGAAIIGVLAQIGSAALAILYWYYYKQLKA